MTTMIFFEISWIWKLIGAGILSAAAFVVLGILICRAAARRIGWRICALLGLAGFAAGILIVILASNSPTAI